jgi:hypothetical protein
MTRWGAASGVAFALCWAPMALVVLRAPDLSSAADIRAFYDANGDLLEVVAVLVGAGFFFFLNFLGTLMAGLRRVDPWGALRWVVLASALMFTTSLNLAVGLVAAARLLAGTVAPDGLLTIHAAAFVIAAPAAAAGTAFFVAITALSFTAAALPRWLGWAAVIGAVANAGALGGIASVSGPLNAGNGIIGGPAVPVIAWVGWILLASLHQLRRPSPARASAVVSGGSA